MTSAEKNIKKNSKSKTHFSGDYSLKVTTDNSWDINNFKNTPCSAARKWDLSQK